MRTQPPLSIFTAMAPVLFRPNRRATLRIHAKAPSRFTVFCASVPPMVFCAGPAAGCGEIRPISALNCFTSSLACICCGFFFDLDLLLVDVAQRHIHAGFVDGRLFFDLADHFVVGLR